MTILDELRSDNGFMACVKKWVTIPARPGNYSPLPEELNPRLAGTLAARGITRLWSHQRDSWDAIRGGKDTVIVTPTASGKTLCYNLPVLQTILDTPDSRALYLFPTKALSQDQQSALNDIVLGGELPVKICTYDGDTPDSLRIAARQSGRIIISNPDMLHSGILPNHPKWIEFFSSLKYIVIDELHTYTGVFGSHMANLLRRLKRIARFYGSNPVFICCSATIGNPGELAERLLERPFRLVTGNGAPAGEKHLILYNPPLIDPVQGIRRGVVLEAEKIALRFLKAGIKTIVFARSRIYTELITSYINQSLENIYTDNNRITVESYRGGYLPGERRKIEKGLRDGSIQGVVSTNALELGIDIGGLDAAILAGMPGSVSSVWQQAGRAGRSGGVSAAVIIASASPVNQYLISHPDEFLSTGPETAFIDPDNIYILMDHLKCAAFEIPFTDGEGFPGDVSEPLTFLEESGILRHTGGKWYWSDRSYPSEKISLRSGADQNVVIIDTTGGKHQVIGEMDSWSAKQLIFKEAVYIHRGNQFMVTELDMENYLCRVEESEVNYYTDSIVKTDIKVLSEDESKEACGLVLKLCDILVRREVSKYKKIKFGSHENLGYGEITLPEDEMHTRSVYLSFEPGTTAGKAGAAIPPGMEGPVMSRLENLLKNTAPVFLLCQPSDIGVAGRVKDPHFETRGLFLFDNFPGGIGLSEAFGGKLDAVLRASGELVRNCPCSEGCPSCVGPKDARDLFSGNPKKMVTDLLTAWLAG
jgi:DEAD/DEAH box helicase domain-containing protein